MNTPTTIEIEAVLDPLLDKLSAQYPDECIQIVRHRDFDGRACWKAYTNPTGYGKHCASPETAVDSILNCREERLRDKKADLESKLEDVTAELAALGLEKETPPPATKAPRP